MVELELPIGDSDRAGPDRGVGDDNERTTTMAAPPEESRISHYQLQPVRTKLAEPFVPRHGDSMCGFGETVGEEV